MSETRAVSDDDVVVLYPDDLRIVRDRTVYERHFKRPLDIALGSVVLIVAAAPMAAIAVAIRLRLGSGVLYDQQRIGAGGTPFTIYKFRTMRPDRRRRELDVPASQDRRGGHKNHDDPRHTRLGRTLRRFSLDELPQLFNVLRGEMSLVGPCLLYTSPSPRDATLSRMPSSA